jgi:hypothetical protein
MKDFKSLPKMKTGGQVKKFEEGGSTGRYQAWDEKTTQPTTKEYKTASGARKAAETKGGSVRDMNTWKPTYDYSGTGKGQDTGNYKRPSGSTMGGGSMIDSQIKEQLGSRNPTFKRGGKVKK